MNNQEHKGEFSVCQFFEDDSYEYTRRYVGAQEASQAFVHYCTSVGARLGLTKRVIITDGGDFINMEWRYGEGIVFPPQTTEPNNDQTQTEINK